MIIHRLNAYKDGHIWITYCEHCGKEADELLGSKCTGKVEPIKSLVGGGYWFDDDGNAHPFTSPPAFENRPSKIKNAIDKPSIDDYVARLIADNGN